MDRMTPQDAKIAALSIAVCDLLVTERAKFNGLLSLLERKGLLTSAELDETMRSIAATPLEVTGKDGEWLQGQIRERMMARLQELALILGPARNAQ